MKIKNAEVWLVVGSQNLYGEEILRKVAENSETIVSELNNSDELPVRIAVKPVVTTPDSILQVCHEANASRQCIGVICWMHTFSPAKMWIAGLRALQKPMAHLHTQFNRELPWDTIDMDFMNLNQSAHGDREFGHICTRMGIIRKIIVGHWCDQDVRNRLATWMRACIGFREMRELKLARVGDNMRQVAVTDGDRVEAQIVFGMEVNGYSEGNVVEHINAAADADIDRLIGEYEKEYTIAAALDTKGARRDALRDAARIELGFRAFLETGGFQAFTDSFECLTGIKQIPGIAVQRLMADGFGFGAEGDWKTAALVRTMKAMAVGLEGGASFMEDYTYHLCPEHSMVLGAHMLEVCPSLTKESPSCEIHPLGIGGKDDPVRLVFTAEEGPAINVALIDMGDRFRFIINEVDAVRPQHRLPNLPVARVVWEPCPNLKTAAAGWIEAGGPHHMAYSQALKAEHIQDLAEMFDVECICIGRNS